MRCAFPFFPSRDGKTLERALGLNTRRFRHFDRRLRRLCELCEESRYAHALCWSHSRRELLKPRAPNSGRDRGSQAHQRALRIEDDIPECSALRRSQNASSPHAQQAARGDFLCLVDRRLEDHGLRPTTPFTKALNYVRERRLGLEIFLPMQTCRWTPIIWSAICVRFRWAGTIQGLDLQVFLRAPHRSLYAGRLDKLCIFRLPWCGRPDVAGTVRPRTLA